MNTKADNGVSQSKKPILALGELLIDLIPCTDGMRIEQAGSVIKATSGSAGITACMTTRLGGNGGFIGKVGRDSLSQLATSSLSAECVDMSHTIVSDEGQIGLAFLEYLPEGRNYQYYRTGSVGSKLRAEDLDEGYIASAYIVHFPGMLLELNEDMRSACQQLVAFAKKHGVMVSFDPNIRREIFSDGEAFHRMLWAISNSDLIAPTLEEGRIITGEQTVGNVLRALHAMGPRTIALTCDENGCMISRDGYVAIADGISVDVVDPTGAGDALAAALCVGSQEGMSLEQLAEFCNCTGTLVCMRKGAIGMALPTREQVNEMVASGICPVHSVTLDALE